jgi:hypothetical protein
LAFFIKSIEFYLKAWYTIMANNKIAYGLAKEYGIDTKGMSPKEVWEALKEKGVSNEQASYRQNTSYDEITAKTKELENKYNSELPGNKNTVIKTTNTIFANDLKKASETIDENKRWRVEVKPADAYGKDYKLYRSSGGSTVAITPDGDIISLCKNQNDKTISGKDLLAFAVKNGGKKLDAFSGLYEFYARNNFEPVSWTPFDKEYKPDGWEEPRDKEEPVIFWKYTGKPATLTEKEFLSKVKPSANYDEAQKLRDKEIE